MFVLEDYQSAKTFSSFLPGIAGEDGRPIWAFFANVGQCMGGFGVNNRETPITPFDSATLAYQNITLKSFRTFIKIDGEVHQPFLKPHHSQTLSINKSNFTITERNDQFEINITYSSVPHANFSALIRKVAIKNISASPATMAIVDGLPIMFPFGLSNGVYKEMVSLMAAYCEVHNLEHNAPFIKFKTSTSDNPMVSLVHNGNGFVSIDQDGKRLANIVDIRNVFGHNLSLLTPDAFMHQDYESFSAGSQQTENKMPCAFSHVKKTIKSGENYVFYSLFGSFDSQASFNAAIDDLAPKKIEAMIQESETLIENLLRPAYVKTGMPLFDNYMKQTFLDNGIRGGFPTILNDLNGGKVYYIYSRKHGDMERDYNAFQMPNSYYSSGPGNFRDVNQNRRSDLCFYPFVGDYNIHQFFSLIQADGHNPLNVKPPVFSVADNFSSPLLDQCPDELKNAIKPFLKRFEPSELFTLIVQKSTFSPAEAHRLFSHILSHAKQEYAANFAEGYWIDHWTYNTDLLENYISLFPDKLDSLLFRDDYRYFYSTVYIEPRSEKYALLPDGRVRQYGAINLAKAKKDARERNLDLRQSAWLQDKYGHIVQTTLASKIFNLILIKFATLDPEAIGVEMEAEKPGWNDAMNGLPGLFSSGVSESVELLRLVRIAKSLYEGFADREVDLLEEQATLLDTVDGLLQEKNKGHINQFDYWDRVATARETFRSELRYGSKGVFVKMAIGELIRSLNTYETVLMDGLRRAKKIGSGILPSYLIYRLDDYEPTGRTNHLGYSTVRAKRFVLEMIPPFLEASARAYKLQDGLLNHDDHLRIKDSDLFDKPTGMYKTCADLEAAPFEIGRIHAFTKGWLERECNFLHMAYKYLLGLLRAGLYTDFYEEIKKNWVIFMNPNVYGRSPIENSSFIVPTCNPDKVLHGQGFFARLTGANAEMIDMYVRLFAGPSLFAMEGGLLKFQLAPALSKEFFNDKKQASFMLFGKTLVTYTNRDMVDCYDSVDLTYRIDGIDYKNVRGSLANHIRDGKIAKIDVTIRSKK